MATKKTDVKKDDPKIKKVIDDTFRRILSEKTEALIMVWEKTKDGFELTSRGNGITHQDIHEIIQHLMSTIHPGFGGIMSIIDQLREAAAKPNTKKVAKKQTKK